MPGPKVRLRPRPAMNVVPKPNVCADAQSVEDNPSPQNETGGNGETHFRDIPPTYVGHLRLLNWGNTSASGMYFKAELLDVDVNENHPFKGLRAARASKTEGQRMQIVVNFHDELGSSPGEPVYKGESILVWWAEDCAAGMQVTLRIDESVDGANFVHPFEGMETGKSKGEILALVAWAIDDQEIPEASRATKSKKSFSELAATAQTHILCRDGRFFHWLERHENKLITDQSILDSIRHLKEEDRPHYCEHVVKIWCGIGSRSEFNEDNDHGRQAKARWDALLSRYQEMMWGPKK